MGECEYYVLQICMHALKTLKRDIHTDTCTHTHLSTAADTRGGCN